MDRCAKAIAAVATILVLGCSDAPTEKTDSGSTGLGGEGGVTGDGGPLDSGACVAVCGMVTGVLADHPSSCTFPLPCSEPLGFTSLVVFVDSQQVPQDLAENEGWNYVGTSRSAVELHGQACAAAMGSNVPVDVDYLCELP